MLLKAELRVKLLTDESMPVRQHAINDFYYCIVETEINLTATDLATTLNEL
jgi:hypothetical protein